MANFQRLWTNIRNQCRQVRLEFIAAPLFELVKKIRSPILVVNFEAVAEDRVRNRGLIKGLKKSVARILQIIIYRRFVQMIQDIAFGSKGGTLNLHSAFSGYEEKNFGRRIEIARQPNCTIMNVG